MLRRVTYGLLISVLALNLFVGTRLYLANAETAEKDDIYQNLELFTRTLERVRKDYVDGESLTYRKLIQDALEGMLSSLDPHSEFMDASKFGELREDTEGAFGGVGLVVGVRGGLLTVVSPMEDTPAFKAGIKSGDQIVRIDGRSAERMNLQEAVRLLRGQPGTEVELTLRRAGVNDTWDARLTRTRIKVETVKDLDGGAAFPLGEDRVGYIRMTQFGERTADELDEALRKLDRQGLRALVLDLRGNPGGLLDQAVKVCEKFLPKDQLVVSTEGRRAEDRAEFRTSRNGRHKDLPLAVLVNDGSASASEIVAACLQDSTANGVAKAVLIGVQTFGKGSVQKVIPFPSGDALRLTTAKYYSPNHRVIHLRGVTPDIVVNMTEAEEEAAFFRSRGGLDLAPEDRREQLQTLTDPQLERAYEVLKGVRLFTQRQPAAEQAGKGAHADAGDVASPR